MTDEQKEAPRELTDPESRERARQMRDGQWEFADLVAKHGTLWFCWWDKARRHQPPASDDIYATCLITGMETLSWIRSHPDWWVIGEWDDARYAAPVELTDAGRAALAERDKYDLEPVEGGMVEPGWICTPSERTAA